MQFPTNRLLSPPLRSSILLLSGLLLLSSCAKKPWDETLGEKEYEAGLKLASEMALQNTQCNKGMQTDLTFEYATVLGKRTFSGFLQYSPVANYKFVASNPLGQPVVIIAGNQKKYQMINTLDSKFTAGGMTSFALRYKLPIHFLKGRWDDWLTGKNTIPTEFITNISNDEESGNIWITYADNQGVRNISHLLIDPEKKVIVERVLETRQKKQIGTIRYDNYLQEQSCSQPQSIAVSGLEYGTTIDIQLAETKLNTDLKKYELSPPQGYLRQFRP